MVDVLLAYDRITINQNQGSIQHIFKDTAGADILVDSVLWVEVTEIQRSLGNNGLFDIVYDLTMAYFAGTPGEEVVAEIRRITTDETETPVLRATFNQFGVTPIGMNVLQLDREDNNTRYNVFNWSTGAVSGTVTNIHSQRVQRNTVRQSAIVALTGATLIIHSNSSRNNSQGLNDTYDYIYATT